MENRNVLPKTNVKQESMNWIIQHLASNENYSLLSSIHVDHHSYFNDNQNKDNQPRFDNKTRRLFLIAKLRNIILYTPFNQLYSYCYQENNIFIDYHKLYPKSKMTDPNWLKSQTHKERDTFSKWVGTLFTVEVELKVQMILSTEFWKNNYKEHKKLNDLLLHPNRYPFKHQKATDAHIPNCDILHFISNCANGDVFIQRIHQQLDYLGQQCTKNGLNLNNLQNNTVKKIREFLKKHTFRLFKSKWAETMNHAQNTVCAKGKDFLSRLIKADINKIISGDFDHNHPPSPLKHTPSRSPARRRITTKSPSTTPHQSHQRLSQSPSVQIIEKSNRIDNNRISPEKISKFALRTVVDVQIDKNWCSGTIIKRYDDGSVKIALHADELDDDGKYKYDSHTTVPSDRIIHCINEDGEYEMDDNDKLIVDPDTASSQFSSPQKQREIRKEKRMQSHHRSPHHSQRDRDQNRNRNQNRPQKHRANRTLPSFIASPQRSSQRQTTSSSTFRSPVNIARNFSKVLQDRSKRNVNVNKNGNNNHNRNTVRNLSQQLNGMDIESDKGNEADTEQSIDPKVRKALDAHAHPSQSSILTEPDLSGSTSLHRLSPNTLKQARKERVKQFQINGNGSSNTNTNTRTTRRTSPQRRRKRSREEFEKQVSVEQSSNNNKRTNSNTSNNAAKRRRVQTRSLTKAAQEKQKEAQKQKESEKPHLQIPGVSTQRRSPRLLAKKNSQTEEEQKNKNKDKSKDKDKDKDKNKNKNKRKIQTRIIGNKDKNIAFTKGRRYNTRSTSDNNKNNNKNKKKEVNDNGSDSGEEIEWSDDMDEATKKLCKSMAQATNKRKGPKAGKWTKEAEKALKECYAKHEKIRKSISGNYAIWDRIKQDSTHCKYWNNRSAVALRDKCRSLLGLDKKTKKKGNAKKSDKR